MPSEKIQRVYPAVSGAPRRLEVMLGWPRQEDLLRMFHVKNNSKSDRLPKKRESSFEENANTILRIYSKKRSYSLLALCVANCSFSHFFFLFKARKNVPFSRITLGGEVRGRFQLPNCFFEMGKWINRILTEEVKLSR